MLGRIKKRALKSLANLKLTSGCCDAELLVICSKCKKIADKKSIKGVTHG